ncbi:hypothetical protein TNCV_2975631 [Trichonephila clavipes]|nr:hypothetical protein TNCV_2975631 [Trichonephila clavipes]
MLTAEPKNPGSNPGEGMDVSKCIVLMWYGGIVHIRRAESLAPFFIGRGKCVGRISDRPQDFLPKKMGWNKVK